MRGHNPWPSRVFNTGGRHLQVSSTCSPLQSSPTGFLDDSVSVAFPVCSVARWPHYNPKAIRYGTQYPQACRQLGTGGPVLPFLQVGSVPERWGLLLRDLAAWGLDCPMATSRAEGCLHGTLPRRKKNRVPCARVAAGFQGRHRAYSPATMAPPRRLHSPIPPGLPCQRAALWVDRSLCTTSLPKSAGRGEKPNRNCLNNLHVSYGSEVVA